MSRTLGENCLIGRVVMPASQQLRVSSITASELALGGRKNLGHVIQSRA